MLSRKKVVELVTPALTETPVSAEALTETPATADADASDAQPELEREGKAAA
ncbi:hypothetical protein D3C75_1266830 [compost metagenome]